MGATSVWLVKLKVTGVCNYAVVVVTIKDASFGFLRAC